MPSKGNTLFQKEIREFEYLLQNVPLREMRIDRWDSWWPRDIHVPWNYCMYRAVNQGRYLEYMQWLSRFDGPLMLQEKLQAVDKIHPHSNKFVTSVKIKATGESLTYWEPWCTSTSHKTALSWNNWPSITCQM